MSQLVEILGNMQNMVMDLQNQRRSDMQMLKVGKDQIMVEL